MHARAAELLNILGMRPHPEGGHYVELFRSPYRVHVLERKVERAAITTIYFLVAAGEFSRWHRVQSDEIWHYHEGDAIELLLFDDRGLRRMRLGAVRCDTGLVDLWAFRIYLPGREIVATKTSRCPLDGWS